MFDFGRETCGVLPVAKRREWLITNGIGGFGMGTIAGTLTRRYHGLLIAALNPPLGRTLPLAKLNETSNMMVGRFPCFVTIGPTVPRNRVAIATWNVSSWRTRPRSGATL